MISLETRLGYKFRNSLLLAEALTHPSLAYETQCPHFDNQRLEFLGDAVLELALTSRLYDLFPSYSEGDLTKMRARLVSKHALFAFAKSIELGSYVLLGKGEEKSGGRMRASTLADAFEALLGAIYIDAGFEKATEIILTIIEPSLIDINEEPDKKNPKGRLQEILQSIIPESPVYSVTDESGPDHHKQFNISVSWVGKRLATGSGSNKKEAEANAARQALKAKSWE
jgi:ribonuclease-3